MTSHFCFQLDRPLISADGCSHSGVTGWTFGRSHVFKFRVEFCMWTSMMCTSKYIRNLRKLYKLRIQSRQKDLSFKAYHHPQSSSG
uniref:Uncharacterized protein n=1 Tax=Romanomermis culicivorax TaxID=13658 RepID=A0A915IFN8_ROMCU